MRALQFRPCRSAPIAGSIVLLAGARQRAEDFIDAGFERALQASGLGFELVLAEPELAHVTDRTWLRGLRDEILQPAQRMARPIWLGGISLGAFQALRYAAGAPADIDGLCLIAPY